jgi:hypothetical protein
MRYRASSVVVHPQYSDVTQAYDVALVFLSQCAALGPNVQVIQLASQEGERRPRG